MSIVTKFMEKCAAVITRTPKSCSFCKRNSSDSRIYRTENNQKIKVCKLCVEYAERRAYRKI